MLDVLKFVMSDLWTFFGTVVLLLVICVTLAACVESISARRRRG